MGLRSEKGVIIVRVKFLLEGGWGTEGVSVMAPSWRRPADERLLCCVSGAHQPAYQRLMNQPLIRTKAGR